MDTQFEPESTLPSEKHRDTLTEKETGRLESFSDGVFAVAITLLVLDLVVPVPTPGEAVSSQWLARALAQEWPSYLALVTSFGTILIMWINHHAMFRMVRRVDTRFMFANGYLLLIVAVVPFVTALIARYLDTSAAPTACAVYAVTFAVGNTAYNLLWWSVAHERRLLHPHVTQARVDQLTNSYRIGFPLYVIATALAFWNAYLSMGICFSLWILWALTGYERAAERESVPVVPMRPSEPTSASSRTGQR